MKKQIKATNFLQSIGFNHVHTRSLYKSKRRLNTKMKTSQSQNRKQSATTKKSKKSASNQVLSNPLSYFIVKDSKHLFNNKAFDVKLICQRQGKEHNMYYQMKMLGNNQKSSEYILLTQWGRIGMKIQEKYDAYTSFDSAYHDFLEAYRKKIMNGYCNSNVDYTLVRMN